MKNFRLILLLLFLIICGVLLFYIRKIQFEKFTNIDQLLSEQEDIFKIIESNFSKLSPSTINIVKITDDKKREILNTNLKNKIKSNSGRKIADLLKNIENNFMNLISSEKESFQSNKDDKISEEIIQIMNR